MAILDWLKEIPLSAIYKERLVDSEKQIALLEKENAALKQENTVLKARLEKDGRTHKNKVINKSTQSHSGHLGEIKEKLSLILSKKEAYGDGEISNILGVTEKPTVNHSHGQSNHAHVS